MTDLLQFTRIAFWHLHACEGATRVLPDRVPDDALLRLACRHRVSGLWAAAGIPPAGKRQAYGQVLYSARVTFEAERIFQHLQSILPSVGLIKGPALAVQAWPQPGARNYDDLDFRCGREHFDKLGSAFSALGYKPEFADPNRQANLWYFGWGIAFVNDDGLRVECNYRLFPPHYPAPTRLEELGDSVWTPLLLDHQTVLAPTPAAHLLLCGMHAIWHGWERLSWGVDIAGLMIRHPGALEQARRLAGEAGFPRQALEYACRVANGFFGPLPGASEPLPAGDRELGDAVTLLLQTGRGRFAGTRRMQQRLCSRKEWIGSVVCRGLTPGDPDFQRWSFAAGQRYRYWLLRPLRLLTKPFFRPPEKAT